MSDTKTRCLECGALLLNDLDHDVFDTAVHACVLDEWLWFEYEPPGMEFTANFEQPLRDRRSASAD